jgi:hypothetical protein
MLDVVKVNEKIWQYKNLHQNINVFLEKTSESFWMPYTNAVNPDGSECESLIIGSSTMLFPENKIYNEILEIFIKCFQDYIFQNNLNIPIENLDINPVKDRLWMEQKYILLRKYMPGSRMSAHEDGGVDIVPKYTGLLYFNDSYDGGEIAFPTYNIKIKPETASMVIFPSNIPHEVLLLNDGDRYAASAYLYETPDHANV